MRDYRDFLGLRDWHLSQAEAVRVGTARMHEHLIKKQTEEIKEAIDRAAEEAAAAAAKGAGEAAEAAAAAAKPAPPPPRLHTPDDLRRGAEDERRRKQKAGDVAALHAEPVSSGLPIAAELPPGRPARAHLAQSGGSARPVRVAVVRVEDRLPKNSGIRVAQRNASKSASKLRRGPRGRVVGSQ